MSLRTSPHYLSAGLLAGLLLACGGGGDSAPQTSGGPTATGPVISAFSATQPLISAGGSTTLTATFTGGTGVLSPGGGAVTSGVPVPVSPLATTMYTLTVTGGSGQSTSLPVVVGVRKSTYELVSLTPTGLVSNPGNLADFTCSADGRFVCFSYPFDDLVAGDTNGGTDVFVRDRQSGTTTLVSRAADGSLGNAASTHPRISADGRFVVFESRATNLVAGHAGRTRMDVYRKDLQTGAIVCVSVDNMGSVTNGDSSSPTVSADGRYVAFTGTEDLANLGVVITTYAAYVRDTVAGTTAVVSRKNGTWGLGVNPVISGDGTQVIYESWGDNLNLGGEATNWQLYRFNRNTLVTTLVTANLGGSPRNGGSESSSRGIQASCSADGRYVTFCTTSDNLVTGVAGVTGLVQNVYVKDTQTGDIALLSQTAGGAAGNGDSQAAQGGRAAISGDGTWVTYNTHATNLIGAQYSTMLVNIFTGRTDVLEPATSSFIGDTDPFISPDTHGRFVLLKGARPLDSRYASNGIFLMDRHVAPLANAGPDQNVAHGALVTLTGAGSSVSPNDFPVPTPALSYQWTQLQGPTAVTFSSPTAVSPTFTASASGTYVFKLVVNDTVEDSVPALVVIRVP